MPACSNLVLLPWQKLTDQEELHAPPPRILAVCHSLSLSTEQVQTVPYLKVLRYPSPNCQVRQFAFPKLPLCTWLAACLLNGMSCAFNLRFLFFFSKSLVLRRLLAELVDRT